MVKGVTNMKKFLSLICSLVLIVSLAACNTNNSTEIENVSNQNQQINSKASNIDSESSSGAEWRQFLKEYEEWVDKYIVIYNKYKSNPTDLSILSDYTDMAAQLVEWSEKTENVQKELESASSEELAEYSKELLRIAGKMTEIIE